MPKKTDQLTPKPRSKRLRNSPQNARKTHPSRLCFWFEEDGTSNEEGFTIEIFKKWLEYLKGETSELDSEMKAYIDLLDLDSILHINMGRGTFAVDRDIKGEGFKIEEVFRSESPPDSSSIVMEGARGDTINTDGLEYQAHKFSLVFISFKLGSKLDALHSKKQGGSAAQSDVERLRLVNQFVKRINTRIRKEEAQNKDGLGFIYKNKRHWLRLVVPSFFARGKGGNGSYPSCGPGSVPIPVPGTWYESNIVGASRTERKVKVYILDTLYPESEKDVNYSVDYSEAAIKNHVSLKQWWGNAGKYKIEQRYKALMQFEAQRPFEVSEDKDHRIQMDHGPFVADIIYRLAPSASLCLVEAINHYNIGSLESTAAVLEWLYHQLQADPITPKIVNMSFVFDIPAFGHDYMPDILETLTKQYQQIPSDIIQQSVKEITEFWSFLDDYGTRQRLWALLRRLFQNILEIPNTLIIAAAGNNSEEGEPQKAAELPAAIDGVVGVGAFAIDASTQQLVNAPYSNKADFQPMEAIYAYGGGRKRWRITKMVDHHEVTETLYISDRGVVGPYLNTNFDYLGTSQTTESLPAQPVWSKKVETFQEKEVYIFSTTQREGKEYVPLSSPYAMWSGTSFAAARVTGKIAAYLAENKDATLWDALQNLPPDKGISD